MNHIINPQIWEIFQWSSMTWQSTPFFFLFITFLIYVYFFIFQEKKSEGTLFIPFQTKTIQSFATWRSKLGKLPVVLKLLALAFIILALARPQTSNTKSNKNVEGIDIVIVLDVSDSMLIEDMRPENRLESAKLTIKKFIEKRSSDKIGMTIFAGEAFTLIPPTLDYPLILDRLKDLQTAAKARIKDGTALGVAMA
ncbi:MAG: vWA domain-containing protein, partial [Pseudobdellovibrionaceae bacterium]